MNDIQVGEGLRDRLAAIVGASHVLTAPEDVAPYCVEQRELYRGRTPAVVLPGSTEEVAAILRLSTETGTPVVPQAGNTGLVGAQVPDESGREIVLSVARLDRIRDLDPDGGTMVAEAGVILEKVQEAAAGAGLFFPLALGAQGSCRVGGNIATNAGGTGVLAYGNMRELVLGLEVALPTGEVWHGLRRLKKDNAGYDLKQLFIGSEGTLGVITAAVLKLFAAPRGRAVAFAGLSDPDAALALFRGARAAAGPAVTGFEILSRTGLEFVVAHLPGARDPLAEPHPWYALVEISSARSEEDAQAMLEEALAAALGAGDIADAAIAASLEQAAQFWRIRHGLAEVQRFEGGSIKHDVSVPVARIPEFLARAGEAVRQAVPGARPVPFGHMGDGNIHFNVSQPRGADKAAFLARWVEVNAIVHAIVAEMGGSIAAEHGIGRLKRGLLADVRSPLELDLMRRLKRALDPNDILNPGRVI
ncbi:MAG TPA: FAD-binding oxidoreductase [Afifellaceae bacterium]|nr:FAD-binding oxidoreductase [Afifellaceae bacterium]